MNRRYEIMHQVFSLGLVLRIRTGSPNHSVWVMWPTVLGWAHSLITAVIFNKLRFNESVVGWNIYMRKILAIYEICTWIFILEFRFRTLKHNTMHSHWNMYWQHNVSEWHCTLCRHQDACKTQVWVCHINKQSGLSPATLLLQGR